MMQSDHVEVLSQDGVSLVFGLEWFPLLGSHSESQARALTRRQRAHHWVVSSGGAAAVGLLRGRLSKQRTRRYCSAAAAFAALHPTGTVAAVLPLAEGSYWLVAVHEGAVMARTDQLHHTASQLHDTVRLLREAHPGLILHDEGQVPSGLLDALFEIAQDRAELRRITVGVRGLALCGLLGGVAVAGVVAHGGVFLTDDAGPGLTTDDGWAAWQAALAASVRSHSVQGVAGLRVLLEAFHDLPVDLGGWHLAEAECRAQSNLWRCQARYRRNPSANNEGFISSAPSTWALSFDPLEGAIAVWTVPIPALALSAAALRTSRDNDRQLLSALQSMRPAFSELRLGVADPLPLKAPLDAQQRLVPRPPGITRYQRRTLRLQAPLRSFSLLLPEAVHLSWDRAHLQLADTFHQPSLRSSRLQLVLSGVLYEIDESEPASTAVGNVGNASFPRAGEPRV